MAMLEFPKKKKNEEEISIERWQNLVDKTGMHPREDVLRRWVTDSASFDSVEFKKMKQHLGICPDCIKASKNIMPLLHEEEKAS